MKTTSLLYILTLFGLINCTQKQSAFKMPVAEYYLHFEDAKCIACYMKMQLICDLSLNDYSTCIYSKNIDTSTFRKIFRANDLVFAGKLVYIPKNNVLPSVFDTLDPMSILHIRSKDTLIYTSNIPFEIFEKAAPK